MARGTKYGRTTEQRDRCELIQVASLTRENLQQIEDLTHRTHLPGFFRDPNFQYIIRALCRVFYAHLSIFSSMTIATTDADLVP